MPYFWYFYPLLILILLTSMHFKNTDIPRVFYSDMSAKPIEHCSFCAKSLLEDKVFYSIEKLIKNHRVDFEYAICFDCSSQLKSEMSEESSRNIEKYMQNCGFVTKSQAIMYSDDTFEVDDFLRACMIKETSVDELTEYQMIGVFEGNQISEQAFPLIIGAEAIEEMNALLSAKTRGEMDKYLDELTGLPPEFVELFKEKKLLLI